MTLSKLAQLANVSVSVVSKAFSGRDDVSEAMRNHVFAVAKEHGCFEQFYHAPYDRPVAVLIVPEVISEYYTKYIHILKERMDALGYTMLVSINNFDAEMTAELVKYYTEYSKINAVIVFGKLPKVPDKINIAFVSIGGYNTDFGCRVHINSEKGFRSVVSHLKETGHKRIAYVGEPLTESKREMLENIISGEGIELDPRFMICSRFRFADAGKDGVKTLLSLDNRPDAIIGAYGYITQGILAELAERGISVPDDISVISMGDDPYPLHPTLNVSYISSMTEKICDKIMEILKDRIGSQKPNAPMTAVFDSEFKIGDTIKTR